MSETANREIGFAVLHFCIDIRCMVLYTVCMDNYEQIKSALASENIKRVRSDFYSRHKAIINRGYKLLGVCIPEIKKIVKSVDASAREKIIDEIFADGEKTFEGVLIAGCLAARKNDYDFTSRQLKRVIELFDSWAHVDTVVPWLRWVETEKFLSDFDYLLRENNQYAVRFYIIFMMNNCITAERINIIEDKLKQINYGDYYVDMGAAWLLAEVLVKDYASGLKLLEKIDFPKFVHNKALQKARESFRISQEQKQYLKTLKK